MSSDSENQTQLPKKEPYDKDFLQRKNPVHSDELIVFREEDHYYSCFNQYVDKWLDHQNSEDNIAVRLDSVSSIVKSMFVDKFELIAINTFNKNKDRMANDPTYKYFGVTSVEDLRKRWLSGGAAELGTKMHEVFEIYINLYEQQKHDHDGDDVLTRKYMKHLGDYYEIQFLFDFIENFNIHHGNTYTFFRTELRMYDPVINICGTADLVMKDNKDGLFVIADWKRSKHALKRGPKRPRTHNPRNYGQFLPTWAKIYNSEFDKYSLQLHLYKYMFEKVYGHVVKALVLVVVNPDPGPHDDEFTIEPIPMGGLHEKAIEEYVSKRSEFIMSHLVDPDSHHANELRTRIKR